MAKKTQKKPTLPKKKTESAELDDAKLDAVSGGTIKTAAIAKLERIEYADRHQDLWVV